MDQLEKIRQLLSGNPLRGTYVKADDVAKKAYANNRSIIQKHDIDGDESGGRKMAGDLVRQITVWRTNLERLKNEAKRLLLKCGSAGIR